MMSANTAVFRIWRSSPMTIFPWTYKTFQTQRAVCISARDRFYFNNINKAENKRLSRLTAEK